MNQAAPLRLLSTDFDGTLVGFEPDQLHPAAFVEWLEAWSPPGGGLWMLNTGRWIESVRERLETLRVTRMPDWVGCGEREIYRWDGADFVSIEPWNENCTAIHQQLASEMHEGFAAIRRYLEEQTHAQCIYERESFAGMVASSPAEADRISDHLKSFFQAHPDISVARNDIYFRFCHRQYHKGACLQEVHRLTGLTPHETFAAGDHYNDLPMLHPSFATRIGCPSNAIPAVQACVLSANGYVASMPYTLGLVEALVHFTRH